MAIAGLLLLLYPVVDIALALALAPPGVTVNIGALFTNPLWLAFTIFLNIIPGIFLLIAGAKFNQRQSKGLVVAGCVIGIVLCAILFILTAIALLGALAIGSGLLMMIVLSKVIIAVLGLVMPIVTLVRLGNPEVAAAFARNSPGY